MKKYLFSFCGIMAYFNAAAVQTFVAGGDYSGVNSFDDSDIYVNNGSVLPASQIDMNTPVNLYNSGHISGTINTNDWILNFYNSGAIDGGVYVPGGTDVIQHIRSDAEMTNVNVNGGVFKVKIENYENASFDNVKSLPAGSFEIKDSSIIINDFNDWQNWDGVVVDFEGNVSLIITDVNTVQSGQVINHTQSGHPVKVIIKDLDNMYTAETVLVGDQFVINIVRQTDYNLVYGENSENQDGAVLELIRNTNSDDKLLTALDSANSWEDIERIKRLSYRFNHGILLKPVKTINSFSLMNAMKSETETGIGITPYYTFSDKNNGFGGRIYAGYEKDFMYFNAGISMHKFDYSDKMNDFSGVSYVFDIKSKQHINKFWLGEAVGLSLTDFKADYVSIDNNLKTNPIGTSWYGDLSAGYDFEIYSDIKLVPHLGFAYQRYSVADVSENDSFIHVGSDVKYSFNMDGIKYEYSLSGMAGTNKNLSLGTNIGFLSITDGAGVSAGFNMLKDDTGLHYQISLNAKLLF